MNHDEGSAEVPNEVKVNRHVSRLNRFLPFSASHDQIYEEYQTGDDGLSLRTKALDYVLNAVRADARCIVLTGDAGHGKTHLCRRLLEEYLGYSPEQSRELLLTRCDGNHDISPAAGHGSEKKLRIHKDFSEIDPAAAALFIEEHGDKQDSALVICANEGRLRAIISSGKAGEICDRLHSTFQHSFLTGISSIDSHTHIVNLNFQSISAKSYDGSQSLVRMALHEWVSKGNRWVQSCGNCALAKECPIKRNRELLGAEGKDSEARLDKLERLCSTVERLGRVITIREMLMFIAYLITGGMVCQDVKQRLAGRPRLGWQYKYAYYNLLFEPPESIPEDRLYKGLPILSVFSRLDPGRIAVRSVDDRLLNEGDVFAPGQVDLQFSVKVGNQEKTVDGSTGIDDVIGSPQSRADLSREAGAVREIVAALRRRDFFDGSGSPGEMLSRLGFRHGDDFLSLLEEKLSPPLRIRLKNLIVAGLHGIQGLRMSSTETSLYLVDPAFGRASADAAIIAGRIPTNSIQILSSANAWNLGAMPWTLPKSVDWIDRTIVVRVEDRQFGTRELPLDLLAFECVVRSASGFISEDFYAQEMRRIRAFLGKLAELGQAAGGQVSLFLEGQVYTVSLDEGVIQVGGGA